MRTTYLDGGKCDTCSGCAACCYVCPVDAIKMVDDEEGFKYPKVDENICVNCGKCKTVCPFENINIFKPIKTYAAVNKNTAVLELSTSGGVFPALAKTIISQGGYVCGAIIENNNIYHILSNGLNCIDRMSGSKYVQSDIKCVFSEIEDKLKYSKVLFTGTPCQCAAVKNTFKNSSNLLTMDFICHGVPNQQIFHDYVDYLQQKEKQIIQYKRFRYKDDNHFGYYDVYTTNDGETKINPIYKSWYLSGFQLGLFLRESCNQCPYASIKRCSDITVCDYWGVEKYHDNLDISKGVSALIINTDLGENLLVDSVNLLNLYESKIDNVAKENANMCINTPKNPNRDAFFKERINYNYEKLAKKYMKLPNSNKLRIKEAIPIKLRTKLKKMFIR